jgi:glycosyltransferase involved in cell wall biosynthesis
MTSWRAPLALARRHPFATLLLLAVLAQAALLIGLPEYLDVVAPWVARLREAPHVCITTADPVLLASSRGTAEALWNLASTLADAKISVHIIIIAPQYQLCVDSSHNIFIEAHRRKHRITSSCAFIGDKSGSYPLIVRSRLAKHFSHLKSMCHVLISHEWWAPLQDVLAADLLTGHTTAPVSIVNVHGGTIWASSWESLTQHKYSDWLQDSDERVSTFLSDFLVFPNSYMHNFHETRWRLPQAQVVPNIVLGLTNAARRGSMPTPISGIAFVGSVETRKGIDVLVQTLVGLRDFPLIRFEVFGNLGTVDGVPAQKFLADAVKPAHHIDCVVHGAVESNKLWPYLKKHKLLLVMPTLLENQPMTIILAYQHGVPLVSYDVGGVAGMLSESSRPLVLIPPDPEQLQARISIALRNGIAFVPDLSPEMFTAQQYWVSLVRQAIALAKERRKQGAVTSAVGSADNVFAVLHLSGNSTTDEVAAQLASNSSALELVLLLQPGYRVKPSAHDDLVLAAVQLARSPVAGFVSWVEMGDGSLLYPQPPYYLLASAWYNCGPEAPLVVKTRLLVRYLQLHPGITFRPWLFTLWLFHTVEDRQILLRAPHAYFSFHGCFDSIQCFWSEELMESPNEMLAQPHLYASRQVPPGRITTVTQTFEKNFAGLLSRECGKKRGSAPDPVWMRAAAFPRLCNGTHEHGLFTLVSLKKALLHTCGAHCVFLSSELPEPPASSLGWALDSGRVCWREVGSNSQCSEWFHQRSRTLPFGVDCLAPVAAPRLLPLAVAPRLAQASGKCDLLLSKEEHPPAGKCAPKIILAGFDGCGVHGIADLLRKHPAVNASVSSQEHTIFSSRKAFYELDAVRASTLFARRAFAQQFADSDGDTVTFDDTLTHMHYRPELPSRLKRLMPSAKVVLLACNPTTRFWNIFHEVEADGGKRKAEMQKLLKKVGASTYDLLVRMTMLHSALGEKGVKSDELLLQQLFLERGFYAVALLDWLREFGKDNVLVVSADALQNQTATAMASLYSFAGLTQVSSDHVDLPGGLHPWGQAPRASQVRLSAAYVKYNRWLADLLGEDYPLTWDTKNM